MNEKRPKKWGIVSFFGYRSIPKESVSPAVQRMMKQLDRGETPTSQYFSGKEKAKNILVSAAITVACLAGSGVLFYLASAR